MISSVAVNVMIRNNCNKISIVMYSFFRVSGSFDRWNWLAMSIRGRSHVVSVSSGADKESVKNNRDRFVQLSLSWFRKSKLMRLINRL